MGMLLEILLTFIPPKLMGVLLSLGFVAAGVYMWTGGGAERAFYDAAVGPGSKTVQAEIRYKKIRSESTEGYNDHDTGSADVPYLILSYEEDGKYHSLDARVDRDEYDKVKEGDEIRISFHPGNSEYVVTPMKARPGVFWFRAGAIILVLIGLIFILMILASLAGD